MYYVLCMLSFDLFLLENCGNLGARQCERSRKMKRLISFLIVLAVVFSLTGCNLLPNKDGKTDDGSDSVSDNSGDNDSQVSETDPVIDESQDESTEPEDEEKDKIDPQIQHRINLFLSNFAQAQISQYPCCEYHMLRFVLRHCQINDLGDLEYADNAVHFSKATVDSVLDTYLGTTLTENGENYAYNDCSGSGATITFSENLYHCPADEDESSVYVAVADSITENEDGTHTVNFRVYELNSEYASYDYSAIYQYSSDEAVYDWNLSTVYKAEAVVRDYYRADGEASYQLISLKVVE